MLSQRKWQIEEARRKFKFLQRQALKEGNKIPKMAEMDTVTEKDLASAKGTRDSWYMKQRFRHNFESVLGKMEHTSGKHAAGTKLCHVILKVDVAGSLEALKDQLDRLRNSNVAVEVTHAGVGAVTPSDLQHLTNMEKRGEHTAVLAFNVPVQGSVEDVARTEKIKIISHNVIYHLLDDLRGILTDMMPPTPVFHANASANVLQTFSFKKGKQKVKIAGLRVMDGELTAQSIIQVHRDGAMVHQGPIDTLKVIQTPVLSVAKGNECGLVLEDFNDIQEGDKITSGTIVDEATPFVPEDEQAETEDTVHNIN